MSFTLPTVLCCICGVSIQSNPSNMCVNCLKSQVDITEGISKQLTVFWCRGCGRYQRPPWTTAARESRELLALLLKKIKGINKEVKVVDADFVYTEPHSMRLKIRLTVQKEVYVGAILQQQFIVEYIMNNMQCPDCARSYTEHMWNTVVQVRQKVRHKKTFFYIEQLLLKHNICKKVIGIKESPGGLDFHFNSRSDANTLIDFLRGHCPVRTQESKRLISHDEQSGTANFKFSYLVEIAPLCRNDLVVLPKALARKLGGVNRLMLVHKVTQNIHMIDVTTLRQVDISAQVYYRTPFTAIQTAVQAVEYIILDVESDDEYRGRSREERKNSKKFQLAEVEAARSSDFGSNDDTTHLVTHLGHLLNPGDSALGYCLEHANIPEMKATLPDAIMIRKHYPYRKNRAQKRKFKLKELKKAESDVGNKSTVQRDKDYEEFMQDLEEIPEIRSKIQIYRRDETKATTSMEEDDEDDGFPTIDMDELLSEMDSIGINTQSAPDASADVAM